MIFYNIYTFFLKVQKQPFACILQYEIHWETNDVADLQLVTLLK